MNKIQVLLAALVVTTSCGTSPIVAHEEGKGGASGGMHQDTVQGLISDSMCKGNHAGMIKAGGYGSTSSSCAQKCIKEGSKIVFVDKKTKVAYTLQNAKTATQFLGKNVEVMGHFDTDSKVIHVHHIKAK